MDPLLAFPRGVVPLLLACGLVLGSSACTEAQKEQMAADSEARKRDMAERQLKERATEYWNLIRWSTWDNASNYLEDEKAQLAFLRLHTAVTGETHSSIQDLEVDYVFVGLGQEVGEIRMSWTEVLATQGRVSDKTVTQRWYKHNGKWWVDPEETLGREELGQLDESPVALEPLFRLCYL
jgi:hypothetical protein